VTGVFGPRRADGLTRAALHAFPRFSKVLPVDVRDQVPNVVFR
jgi:hypothetical protein